MTADLLLLVCSGSSALALAGTASEPWAKVFVALGALLTTVAMYSLGAYRAVVRFIGLEFASRLVIALTVVVFLMFAYFRGPLVSHEQPVTWTQLALFALSAFFGLVVSRLTAQRLLRPGFRPRFADRVLIYGAGGAGMQVASALALQSGTRPIGFVDDRQDLQGRVLLGLPVLAPSQLERLKAQEAFDKVLLAIPSVSPRRRREILQSLESLAVKVLVMPAIEDITSGRKRVDELREVQIEDLLEREPVAPIDSLLDRFIRDQSVAVTGAGGSIGSELCRQIVRQGARKLVLFESSEYALYRIDRELHSMPEARQCQIVPVLGTVVDRRHLEKVLATHAVESLYHAAAYKHVPLVEGNIAAAVHNNVFGTLHTVQAALQVGVKNFVLISTDKAVRPTNVMGASKRVCELIVQALAEQHPDRRMSMVRFGNVLASSGSVVPLFREQIRQGGPVTVTHPEITRYFMTIPEAAQLVLQAGSMGKSGEVFVLDMGEPVKIYELAQKMIHLSGLKVRAGERGEGDIEICFTGLRPGEKLYEELLIGDNPERTDHLRILKAREIHVAYGKLEPMLPALSDAIANDDEAMIVGLLQQLVPDFVRRCASAEELPEELSVAAASTSIIRAPFPDDLSHGDGSVSEEISPAMLGACRSVH